MTATTNMSVNNTNAAMICALALPSAGPTVIWHRRLSVNARACRWSCHAPIARKLCCFRARQPKARSRSDIAGLLDGLGGEEEEEGELRPKVVEIGELLVRDLQQRRCLDWRWTVSESGGAASARYTTRSRRGPSRRRPNTPSPSTVRRTLSLIQRATDDAPRPTDRKTPRRQHRRSTPGGRRRESKQSLGRAT